eukprot:CAMPEP_0197696134 /NCGR_PEP_ID=MMETSP1338-20131121/116207_1 /TAXON_ID=43686 ORGANISM="Pelagodinium beii, Strain RCC1491" /NCGR_SAMPLE_ID=MMETSP1338 /ASSEMBLY_ACC=CAM_ASM_000754 /LENGTH=125 /DNA_ID=CAMNT_0043279203 /DNA_START=64 /DNA_END=437 /DNA_ORIENTATION=+
MVDFAAWSRIGGVLSIACLIFTAVLGFLSALPLGFYCIFAGIFIGIFELPFLCRCMDCCSKLARIMGIFERHLILRGLAYMVISVLGFLIYGYVSGNLFMLLALILLALDGIAYVGAHFTREDSA